MVKRKRKDLEVILTKEEIELIIEKLRELIRERDTHKRVRKRKKRDYVYVPIKRELYAMIKAIAGDEKRINEVIAELLECYSICRGRVR